MSKVDIVKDYYGKQLGGSADLKTSACCDVSDLPEWLKPLLARVHSEVRERYYGCGMVVPPLIEGARVLDLGCGSGRDSFLLAQLVGAEGLVVGVDMTDEQLAVAEAHRDHHAEKFGYANVRFLKGYIERLGELGLEPASCDVIVSNCVVNLSEDKGAVLNGVRRLLKPGGEFYFSDVYADRRIPREVREDPVLYGECLGGALYWNDFLRLAQGAGFADPRLVEDRPLSVNDPSLQSKTAGIGFYSATYRLFAIDSLENACEDFGQAVVYKGTIPHHPASFTLDKHHRFETGRIFPVCGNSFRMLKETRFAPHFEFVGDFRRHFGIFAGCGTDIPFDHEEMNVSAGCC
jgi:arsenite methyltransferase